MRALEQALAHHTPEIHHSEEARAVCRHRFYRALAAGGAQISLAEVGAAWQNGDAERLMRTIKEEEVDLSEYEDYTDAVRQLGRLLDEVSMRHPHSFVAGLPHTRRV